MAASFFGACGEGAGGSRVQGAWGSPSYLRGGVSTDPTALRGDGRQDGDIPLGGRDMDSREDAGVAGLRDGL